MIVAFVSRKGGVGKTTSAVNTAAALASFGQRVLLVDLDSQASASLSLGVARADLAPSAAELLLGRKAPSEVIRPTGVPGVDLVTASADLASVDVDLAPLRDRELRLRQRLAPIADWYDWIFLDCPPALSVVPQNALVACDGFIVPVVPQFLACDGLDLLLAAVERLGDRYGVRTRLIGLLLTMVDGRTRLARDSCRQLRETWGDQVFAAEVAVNVRLAEAPASGRSIFAVDPDASGATAYYRVAMELAGRCGRLAPAIRA